MGLIEPKFGQRETSFKLGRFIKGVRTEQIQSGTIVNDRVRVSERKRVGSLEDAEKEVASLHSRICNTPELLDPAWSYEGLASFKKRGCFDVVFSYTVEMSSIR